MDKNDLIRAIDPTAFDGRKTREQEFAGEREREEAERTLERQEAAAAKESRERQAEKEYWGNYHYHHPDPVADQAACFEDGVTRNG